MTISQSPGAPPAANSFDGLYQILASQPGMTPEYRDDGFYEYTHRTLRHRGSLGRLGITSELAQAANLPDRVKCEVFMHQGDDEVISLDMRPPRPRSLLDRRRVKLLISGNTGQPDTDEPYNVRIATSEADKARPWLWRRLFQIHRSQLAPPTVASGLIRTLVELDQTA